MYVKTSIPKVEGGGAALPKKDRIRIYDVDDVETDIARSLGETSSAGPLTLKTGAKGISIQVSRSSIALGYEESGDPDAKVFADKVEYDYPGDTVAANNFIEANANKGKIIVVESCDGPTKVYGRVCNPMFLTAEPTDNNEARRTHMAWQQEMGDAYLPRVYTGALPDVEDDPSTSGEGI